MKTPILQKHAPTLWIVAGALFFIPSFVNSANNQAPIGIGIMFIIFGIVFSIKKKTETAGIKNLNTKETTEN